MEKFHFDQFEVGLVVLWLCRILKSGLYKWNTHLKKLNSWRNTTASDFLFYFLLTSIISDMAGLAQVEYINISYSNNHKFSDDSHLPITACPHLKYPWCHSVTLSLTFHRGCSGRKGREPLWRGVSLLNVHFIPKECHEWPHLEQMVRTGISHCQSLPITPTWATAQARAAQPHSTVMPSGPYSQVALISCCCTCDYSFLCLLCFIGIFSQVFEYFPSLWYTANFLPFQASLYQGSLTGFFLPERVRKLTEPTFFNLT